jgi:glycosyltransferase involved in cell wall biosynthesis
MQNVSSPDHTRLDVVVLVPCYNEERTIANVVRDFRAALPYARIYVYDNNSRDATIAAAQAAGAIVRQERRQGKGNVVRRMFSDIDADVYIMVDGDDTYDASIAPQMIQTLVEQNCAMVVGRRIHEQQEAYRPGHVLGNQMFTSAIAALFGQTFTDILSGYRVFSKSFVKSFPIFALGFEIETELTVHALTLKLPVLECDSIYKARPEGSASKLNTYRDGFRILMKIFHLVRTERPFLFYSLIAAALIIAALVLAYPLVITFLETGLVPRLPTGVLVVGLAMMSALSLVCGVLLDAVTQARREMKMLMYIGVAQPTHIPLNVNTRM